MKILQRKVKLCLKVTSYYGLLSVKDIPTPVPTNKTIELPYYPGCRYAAYPAHSSEEVCLFSIVILFETMK